MNRIVAALTVSLATGLFAPSSWADAAGDAAMQVSQPQVIPGIAPPIQLITGIAKNTSGHKLQLVTLTFKLYDASGVVIGTAVAQTFNLDAGESWRYEAQATKSFAVTKLGDISAF